MAASIIKQTSGNTVINTFPLNSEQLNEKGDGIDLLVQLAKAGQLDPWNLDIVQVADKYLQAVEALRANDLKLTGKTILYLAILLRMKSDHLAGINYLDPPDEFLESLLEGDDADGDPLEGSSIVRNRPVVRSLDEVLRRRTSTKQPRIRPVTLGDLITELRKVEALESRRSLEEKLKRTDARREMLDYVNLTADDIENLAHEEFQEDTIEQLHRLLINGFTDQQRVSLQQLQHESGLDRISIFLSLLFLSARGALTLEQETFYGDLWIVLHANSDFQPDL